MNSSLLHDVAQVGSHFRVEGPCLEVEPIHTGHINQTFLASHATARYCHQRINTRVFEDVAGLMDNIERVTHHLRRKIEERQGDVLRETLNLVPTLDGQSYWHDGEGTYWRTFLFIDGARSYDIVEDPRHVYSASRAFGAFQCCLADLPGERLNETIPDFHHTRRRFETFLRVVELDEMNRAHAVKSEIDFILEREADMSVIVDLLERHDLPERITHNDTKLNNVLIDDETGVGLCVIDLDTVMPGSVLYDFGDSVRVGAATAAEDEEDVGKVALSLTMFDHLTRGYLDGARDFLVAKELDLLAFSCRLITLECGMRFLTDYLEGDTYFRVSRPAHNLHRCRTQLAMVEDMEHKQEDMARTIVKYRDTSSGV